MYQLSLHGFNVLSKSLTSPLIILLCFLAGVLNGQALQQYDLNEDLLKQYHVKKYDTETGLYTETVYELFFDHDDYLWIFSPEGLQQIDGLNIRSHLFSNFPQLKGKSTNSFNLLADNTILIQDKTTLEHYFLKDGTLQTLDTTLSPDDLVNLWLGCVNLIGDNMGFRDNNLEAHYLGNRDPQFITIFYPLSEDLLKIERGDSSFLFKRGQKVLAQQKGFSTDSLYQIGIQQGDMLYISYEYPYSIYIQAEGQLLLDGPYPVEFSGEKEIQLKRGLVEFSKIRDDQNLGLVIDSTYFQVYRADYANFKAEVILDQIGLRANPILKDQKNKQFFFANTLNSLYHLKEKQAFNTWGLNFMIYSFLPPENGFYYAFSHEWNQKGAANRVLPNSQIFNEVYNKWYKSGEGTIYAANIKGLRIYHPQTKSTDDYLYKIDESKGIGVCAGIQKTETGGILLAYTRNLILLDSTGALEYIDTTRFLEMENAIQDLSKLDNNEYYISTAKGLLRFLPEQNYSYEEVAAFKGKNVRKTTAFTEGYYWITTGNGNYLMKSDTLVQLPLDQRSILETTRNILLDNFGFVWISTENGLFKCRVDELLAYARQEIADVYYHRFSTADGLPSNRFTGLNMGAHILADGSLGFASSTGLTYFHPEEIEIPDLPNKIGLESVWVDGKRLAQEDHISLPIQFSEAIIQLKTDAYWGSKENFSLEYRVNGIDNTWKTVGPDKAITIYRYGPGDYQLEFRMHKGLNFENIAERYHYLEIPLNFRPRFIETLYFPLLIILGTLGIAYLFYRLRLNFFKQQNRLLRAQVEEQTALLQENVTVKNMLISIFSHDIASSIRFMRTLSNGMQTHLLNSNLSAQIKKDYQLLVSSIHKLFVQSQDYLNWMKTEGFGANMEIELLQLSPLVEEVRQTLEVIAAENDRMIINDVRNDIESLSNPIFFKSILHNILDNTIKHGGPGRIVITSDKNKSTLMLIDEHPINFDFERINQFLNKEQTEENFLMIKHRKVNTGVGLYIIKDLLKKNKAKLTILKQDNQLIYEIHFPSSV